MGAARPPTPWPGSFRAWGDCPSPYPPGPPDISVRHLQHLLSMRTLLADHPLVTHKLTLLRDAATDTATFRRLADELVTLLAYEATREIRISPVTVETPVDTASGARLSDPKPLI